MQIQGNPSLIPAQVLKTPAQAEKPATGEQTSTPKATGLASDVIEMGTGARAFNGTLMGMAAAGSTVLALPLVEVAKGGSYLNGFMTSFQADLPAAAAGGVVGGALAAMIPGDSLAEKAIVTAIAGGTGAALAKFTGGNVLRSLVVGAAAGGVGATATDLMMSRYDK